MTKWHSPSNEQREQSTAWLPIALVVGVWFMHVVGSYLWIKAQDNVLMGWDPVGHLMRTLAYYDILDSFTPGAWLQAFALDSFRPPFFHFCAVLMYRLFGVSAQVAVMTNFPFLLILLLAVYGIGRQIGTRTVGVLAAFLVSVFPLTFALTRAFYVDLALAALVSAAIYFLLTADGFRSRKNSLLLGVTIGLGLLTKWTYPLFIVGPFVFLVWSSMLAGGNKTDRNSSTGSSPQDSGRRTGLPSVATNMAGCFVIALGLASLWYAANPDFWVQVYQRSYGGLGGTLLGTHSHPVSYILATLDYVPRHLARSVLSWPFALLFVLSYGALLVSQLNSRTKARPYPLTNARTKTAFWMLTLWWAVPVLVFMLSINREERSWLPALPAFALTMALAVVHLPGRMPRRMAMAALVLFGLTQWVVLSCPKFAGLPQRMQWSQSPLGQIGPLAVGEYIRWPDWQWTDHRYNVADDVLGMIEQDSRQRQIDRPVVGILTRISQLQGDVFRYLARSAGKDMELWDIGETEDGLVTYPRLFLCDYLVVKTGDNDFLNPEAAPVVAALSFTPPGSFRQAFETLAEFPLPQGDRLVVHRRARRDVRPDLPDSMNPANRLTDIVFGDKLRLIGYNLNGEIRAGQPFGVILFWQVLEAMDTDYYTSLKLFNAGYRVWGENQGLGLGRWALTSSWPPGQVIKDARPMEVYVGTPPGEYWLEVALFSPYQRTELMPTGTEPALIGPIQVEKGLSDVHALTYDHPSHAVLGGTIRLVGYNLSEEGRTGASLSLILFWQCQSPVQKNYTVFTHVVDAAGHRWAGKDNQPADGFYPTTAWTAGEVIRDPYDIPLPADIPEGMYNIVVGLYDAETGERLLSADNAADHVSLGSVMVVN